MISPDSMRTWCSRRARCSGSRSRSTRGPSVRIRPLISFGWPQKPGVSSASTPTRTRRASWISSPTAPRGPPRPASSPTASSRPGRWTGSSRTRGGVARDMAMAPSRLIPPITCHDAAMCWSHPWARGIPRTQWAALDQRGGALGLRLITATCAPAAHAVAPWNPPPASRARCARETPPCAPRGTGSARSPCCCGLPGPGG